jgi:FHS family L-fucose permease-like MFS transporter
MDPSAPATQTTVTVSKGGAKRYTLPLILIVSLFFLWGMANNLNDILIKQFKKAFELTDFQTSLVQSAFYFGYFVLAIPASLVMRRYNYKTGIIIGLLLYATGAFLFYPAASMQSYGFFLFALFVIASGLAFLETAANPYVTALGTPQSATFRLNLAQAFNPIGCITGILIGQHFIFSGVEHSKETLAGMTPEALATYYAAETRSVQLPYVIIGSVILLLGLFISITKFPRAKEEQIAGTSSALQSLRIILGKRHFSLAVMAQFFYVGAQVCIWSFLIRYTQSSIPGISEITAANYLTASLVVFTAGRFAGTGLLKKFSDDRLLGSYAVANILLLAVVISFPGSIGVWALVATSFFMSIMFPTIFALGIKDLGEHTKLGSSVLVMAIVGGAVLTMAMGKMSDATNIARAMFVPMVCFVAVAFYGFRGYKQKHQRI